MPEKILIINADPEKKSIKKYVLNRLLGAVCDEIFISSEEYETYQDSETPLVPPPNYDYLIVHNPSSNREPFIDKKRKIISFFSGRLNEIGREASHHENMKETIFFASSGPPGEQIFTYYTEEKELNKNIDQIITFDYVIGNVDKIILNFLKSYSNKIYLDSKKINHCIISGNKNIIEGGEKNKYILFNGDFNSIKGGNENKFLVYGNSHSNHMKGGDGYNYFYVGNNSFSNVMHGGRDENDFHVVDDSYFNTMHGSIGQNNFYAKNKTSFNTMNGGEGENSFYIDDYATSNTVNGGAGKNDIQILSNASKNIINGGDGENKFQISENAYSNITNAGKGRNEFYILKEAHSNTSNGSPMTDEFHIFDSASWNILDGHGGDDIIYAYGNALCNTLRGGIGADIVISLTNNILLGNDDDDFLLNYLVDMHKDLYNLEDLGTIEGGSGNDVIISSGLFLRQDTLNWFDYMRASKPKFLLKGDAGNDFIIPHLPLNRFSIRFLSSKISKIPNGFTPTNQVQNIVYHISTGQDADIIALTAMSAKNATTYIEDFTCNEDKFAFDNEEMAKDFSSQLAMATVLELPKAVFEYNGHVYDITFAQEKLNPIPLVRTVLDGIEISYPNFTPQHWNQWLGGYSRLILKSIAPNTAFKTTQPDYLLYDSNALSQKISAVTDCKQLNRALLDGVFSQKTFTKTYAIEPDLNMVVMTNPTLNLVRDGDKGFKTKAKDLFAREDDKIIVCDSLTENGKACYFYNDAIFPEKIKAVVVVQEDHQGIVFTTQTDDAAITLPKQQTVQTLPAYDFFNRGRFVKVGDQTGLSVKMKIGLVYEEKGKLITTPLSDPIQIKTRS